METSVFYVGLNVLLNIETPRVLELVKINIEEMYPMCDIICHVEQRQKNFSFRLNSWKHPFIP